MGNDESDGTIAFTYIHVYMCTLYMYKFFTGVLHVYS